MIKSFQYHLPVLLPQVLKYLEVKVGKKYIDATLGGGGYTLGILQMGGTVLGIDRDIDAIDYFKSKFPISNFQFQIGRDVFLARGNFASIEEIAKKYGFADAAGIVFDLGLSSHQLDQSKRGFSWRKDEKLDMRADESKKLSAYEVVNNYSKEELYEIFTKYAEELNSGAIASAIVRSRSIKGKIPSTGRLASIIVSVIPSTVEANKTLVRVFQAIRIEVNDELVNLKRGLQGAVNVLGKGGRLVIVSYHSLEDRIVKRVLRELSRSGVLHEIIRRPIVVDENERVRNPRARSAKLRAAYKL